MKNKKLIYLLFPLAVVIWGIIGLKVWNSLSDEEASKEVMREAPSLALAEHAVEQPPKLFLRYPDPFLGKQFPEAATTAKNDVFGIRAVPQSKRVTNNLRTIAPQPPPTAPAVVWPSVEYRGLIENRQKGTRIVMLTINGTPYMLTGKQNRQGINVLHIYPDSLVLSFQRQRRVISRLQ